MGGFCDPKAGMSIQNLGAKSISGREATDRRRRDVTNWINLGVLNDNEKEESVHSQGNSD